MPGAAVRVARGRGTGRVTPLIQCLLVCFAALLVAGVPISVTLVLAACAAIAGYSGYSLELIPLKLFTATNSFPLLAIPFFILAGGIMARGGMSERLIDLARAVVGRVRGGVAMVSVVACMFFAAVSGSTAATTAAIGIVLIPAMVDSGFSRGAAAGLQATAGSIGIIIPPSIPFVLLGVIGGISIGELFLGGVLPGIAIGVALMATSHIIARIQRHAPSSDRVSPGRFARALLRSLLPLLTLVIVLGGIMAGIVTPTEAAVLAVLWAVIVSSAAPRLLLALERRGIRRAGALVPLFADPSTMMRWRDYGPVLADTVKVTGIVVLCIGATAPFAWLLSVEQVPQNIAASVTGLSSNPLLLVLMMIGILLAVGTVIDLTPAMILLVPILQPIARGIGMDPVHFGVLMVMALGIGQSTPPVGIGLFVACSVGRTSIGEMILRLVPFLLAMVVVLLAVAYWPPLTVWLPAILMR